jgi:hypothetical protein
LLKLDKDLGGVILQSEEAKKNAIVSTLNHGRKNPIASFETVPTWWGLSSREQVAFSLPGVAEARASAIGQDGAPSVPTQTRGFSSEQVSAFADQIVATHGSDALSRVDFSAIESSYGKQTADAIRAQVRAKVPAPVSNTPQAAMAPARKKEEDRKVTAARRRVEMLEGALARGEGKRDVVRGNLDLARSELRKAEAGITPAMIAQRRRDLKKAENALTQLKSMEKFYTPEELMMQRSRWDAEKREAEAFLNEWGG